MLEAHRKTDMAFCSCFGTGTILGLTDRGLWGLCASAETTGAWYKYIPASAGSSSVRAGTGLLAGHHSARALSWSASQMFQVPVAREILRRLETVKVC